MASYCLRMRNTVLLTLILLLLTVSRLCIGQIPGQQLFDKSKIHEIKIISLYESLTDTLTKNYLLSFGFGQIQTRKIPYAPALISIDGVVLDSIGIRHKGFNSWWSSDKKPIKININRYKDQQQYDGLSKFNLHNGSGDPSFIRENISYEILRSLGITAPRTAFAKVYIDEDYMGLYRLVEQIDNTFLDVNFGDHQGNLYVQQSKGSGGFVFDWISNNQEDYYESIELENHQKDNDWSSFIHFLDVVNHTPDESFKAEIQAIFDVDEYLQILAFDLAINNLDWYGNSGRNYYLVEVAGKFHWLPWDYNLSWREDGKSINVNPDDYPILIRRILNVPQFYNSFLRKYCALLPLFASDHYNTLVENEVIAIKPFMEVDPFPDYSFEAFETNASTNWGEIPGLKEFAAQRYTDISATLESLHLDCSVVTEIPDELASNLKIYPMPANEVLHVESSTSVPMQLTIVNCLGNVLLQESINETGMIDVSHFPNGVYVLKGNTHNQVYSNLIVIEH